MKTKELLLAALLIFALIFTSCKQNNDDEIEDGNILPTSFKVDIPQSISHSQTGNKSIQVDTIPGDRLYENMALFINIGEGAADIVQALMTAIAVHNINQPMSLSFEGDDDGRTKNLVVIENSSYDGTAYQFQMTITDADSEPAADGGKGIQVFWNTNPVVGVAILKPYNINRNDVTIGNALFRIDYSEAGNMGYEKHMIVSIADLPLQSPLVDPYSMGTLKMFAGKNGDVVDVYGNSNHPNAKFYTNDTGFNWAFTASGNSALNIGVAEVGLPASNSTASDRTTLLETYSMKNVFTTQIFQAWPDIDSADVAAYLYNMASPGYFDNGGFIQGGAAPSGDYSNLEGNILNLTPYVPNDVSNLTIAFKN